MSNKKLPMSNLALRLELVVAMGEMSMKRCFSVTNINNAQTLLWNKYQILAWILIEVGRVKKDPGAAGKVPLLGGTPVEAESSL
jgi:hypothetical protein